MEIRSLILAAGEGKRLRPLTDDRPKGMVELEGKPLIKHQIETLNSAGVEDINFVTGYRADQIEKLGFPTFHNPRYDETNMVYSMVQARQLLEKPGDLIISYADIVYQHSVISPLLESDSPIAITVDRDWEKLWRFRQEDPLSDAETLKLDNQNCVTELGKKPKSLDEVQGQYMGIIKVSDGFRQTLLEIYDSLDPKLTYDGKDFDNLYMTSFLQEIIARGHRIKAVLVEGGWLEVDTVEDLRRYSDLVDKSELSRFYKSA